MLLIQKYLVALIVFALVFIAYTILKTDILHETKKIPTTMSGREITELEKGDKNNLKTGLVEISKHRDMKRLRNIAKKKSKFKKERNGMKYRNLKGVTKKTFGSIGKAVNQKTSKSKNTVGLNFENLPQRAKLFDKSKSDIYTEWIRSSQSLNIHTSLSSNLKHKTGSTKTILVYTSLFGNKEWPNLKESQLQDYLGRYKCPVQNCALTYDQNKFKESDVVVFHSKDILNSQELRLKSDTERPENQIWVYFTSESPFSSKTDIMLDSVFDWTMTYKPDSDLWLPYARYYPLEKHEKHYSKPINYAKSKTKLMTWLVSNCGLMRDAVVHELENYLTIDVGGKCANRFSNQLKCSGQDCDNKISEYKFYLAFENVHCDYYVTEKYWYRAIRNNVVPIVLGAGPYKDPKTVIPGSYIDVLDFDSIEDLAKYIRYLDKNDTAYNEYFKWKEKYKLWQPICDWPFEPYWACEICARLNKGVERKERSMSEFFGVSKNCEGRISRLRQFLERSNHDFTTDIEPQPHNPFANSDNVKEVPYEIEVDYEKEADREKEVGYENEVKVAGSNESPRTFLNSNDNSKTIIVIPCIFLFSLICTVYYVFKFFVN